MSDSSDEDHPFVKYGTSLPEIDGKPFVHINLCFSVDKHINTGRLKIYHAAQYLPIFSFLNLR